MTKMSDIIFNFVYQNVSVQMPLFLPCSRVTQERNNLQEIDIERIF